MSLPGPDADQSRLAALRELRQSSGYKTTTLLVSAFIIASIILGAIYVAVRADDDPNPVTPAYPTRSAPPSAQSAPPTPTVLPPNAFGIPTTDLRGRRIETPTNPLGQILPQTAEASPAAGRGSDELMVDPPAGLMWQRVGGFPLPFSTSDGPASVSDRGVPSGFSRTPQGAVLAAWQIYQRSAWGTMEQTVALLEQSTVITPASQPTADRMIAGRAVMAQSQSQMPIAMFDVPLGVQVANFDTTYAHVKIALPAAQNRDDATLTATGEFDMVWRDGTWKWVLPNDGVDPSAPVVSLSGWSSW